MEQIKEYEYVDLGLPSGLKWATMNIGAETETDYGDYFMWGSIEPNTPEECTWTNVPFNNGLSLFGREYFSSIKDTVYPNGVLAKEYDAAAQIMGSGWRIPTQTEWQELLNNTTNEWATINGVSGRKFTSKINGNSIFIPAAGRCNDGSVNSVGSYGNVWSSSLNTSNPNGAWGLDFTSGNCHMNYLSRYFGRSVRGVRN